MNIGRQNVPERLHDARLSLAKEADVEDGWGRMILEFSLKELTICMLAVLKRNVTVTP